MRMRLSSQVGKGKTISVRQAPTNFGLLAFTLEQPQEGVAVLRLDPDFTAPPESIVVHLPWFVDLRSAVADGKTVRPADGALTVPANAKTVELHWSVKPDTPQLSYESAVAAYKAEYARRYREFMHGTGEEKK